MSKQIAGLAAVLVVLSGCSPQTLNPDPAPARNVYEYCDQLVSLYQRYLAGNQLGYRTSVDADLASQVAVSQCQQGDPAGIPVLERKLTNNGFTLPRRP